MTATVAARSSNEEAGETGVDTSVDEAKARRAASAKAVVTRSHFSGNPLGHSRVRCPA